MLNPLPINALIIDDEAPARATLAAILRDFFPEVQVIDIAKDGFEGLALIEKHRPELVFLDVEMPGLSGIELIHQISFRDFEIIFTTAHKSYSLEAIKFSALDYLLKPIDIEELGLAIAKAKEKKNHRYLAERLRVLEDHLKGVNETPKKIALPAKHGLKVVQVAQIIRCEGDNNYTHFYFEQGNKLLVSKTLREYEKLLSGAGFFRIFQSHLVNLLHVDQYIRGRGGQVRMSDGSLLNVSRDRKKELLDRLAAVS